ncbi:caspase family protein [Ekhidna sp.]|uniref:caspase family protein n=1 Tax=Ekhidna sp. TaxID=2608089 RepID=UPI0032EEE0E9
MKLSLSISLFCLATLVNGQIVSSRSNEVQLDFNSNAISSFAQIEWISPRLEYTNSEEKKLEIKANITSVNALKSVTLHFKQKKDDKPVASRTAYIEDEHNTNFDLTLRMLDGDNWIEIVAETKSGAITREYRNIKVGMDAIGDAVMADRQDYALLFGINKYDNWSDLVNPGYDVEAIGKELEERYGFKVEIVRDAEQDQVMTKLREYAQINYKPQDQLFIFFAGHGQYDDVFGEGFLVAKNSLRNDVSKNSYISHNRIRSNINNIPCEHIFLGMDVCFGGTFDPLLASSRSAAYEVTNDREYLVRKLSKKTRKYLTSGSKEYVSDGVAGSHSPFARNLIEALKSNGGEDRILILDEIKSYMERLKSTPRFGSFGSDENGSDFVFIAR